MMTSGHFGPRESGRTSSPIPYEIDFGRSDEYLDYFDIDYDHWEAICWCATWHIIEGKGGATKSQQKFDPFGRVTQADLNLAIANLKDANK